MLYLPRCGEVLRFDFASEQPLPPIPMDETHFGSGGCLHEIAVDDSGVWVPGGSEVAHVQPSGHVDLRIPTSSANDVAVDGPWLLVLESWNRLTVYDRATGAQADSVDGLEGFELTLLPALGRAAVTGGSDPSLTFVDYGADGTLSEPMPAEGDIRSFGQFPRAFPDGVHFIDGVGQIWDGSSRRYVGSRDVQQDVAFLGSSIVDIGLDRTIRILDEHGTPAARHDLGDVDAGHVAVHGDTVWVFRRHSFEAVPYRLKDFTPLPSEPRLDPIEESYRPIAAEIDADGVVYVAPLRYEELVRWDAATGSYLSSVPLPAAPYELARAPDGGVFVAEGRYVEHVAREASGARDPIGTLPHGGRGIFAAPIGAGFVHFWTLRSIGSDDAIGLGVEASASPDTVAFDPVNRRIFYTARSMSERLLGATSVDPGGAWGLPTEVESARASGPLRPSPDGALVLAGAVLADASTLETIMELSDKPVDHAWIDAETFSVISRGYECCSRATTIYREIGIDGEVKYEFTLPGEPIRLLSFGTHLVLLRTLGDSHSPRPHLARIRPSIGDLDEDGYEDAIDALPLDGTEWSDRDGDGVGDNADAFPDHYPESADSDRDGLGDNGDYLPNAPHVEWMRFDGEQRLSISGVPTLAGHLSAQLHVLDGQVFALCTAREECLPGVIRPTKRPGRFSLALDPTVLPALGDLLEEAAGPVVSDLVGRPVRLDLRLSHEKMRGSLRVREDPDRTVASLVLKIPHRGRSRGLGPTRGAYTVRSSGWWSLTPGPNAATTAASGP